MYTRYYDGYPAQIQPKNDNQENEQTSLEKAQNATEASAAEIASVPKNRLGKLNSEDILLVALLMITLTESKDDFILPLILGALLLE